MDALEKKNTSSVNRCLTPLEEKLQDSDPSHNFELASVMYNCNCHICHKEAHMANQFYQTNTSPSQKAQKRMKGYTWLLEKLSEISNEYSIQLNVPDVVLFRYGKAVLYVQTTRERLLKSYKSPERLKIQEIIKSISSVSRTRKREEVLNNKVMLSVNVSDSGKEIACLRYMAKNGVNDADEFSCADEDGALRVMNENEFSALLWQRQSGNIWRTLVYIQSVLKCKNGIGESFIHRHRFGGETKIVNLEENFSDFSDYEIFCESQSRYCEEIFVRIYTYLLKYSNIQLKSIQGEFVKDENNKIWLVHASFIDFTSTTLEKPTSKPIPTHKTEVSVISQPQEDLIYHLELISKEPKNPRTEKLSQCMKQECEKIMQATKFTDFFSNIRDDRTSITAYQKLRPKNIISRSPTKKRTQVPRCATEQKRLFMSRNSEIDTKSSSPVKSKNSWIAVPKLHIAHMHEAKKFIQSRSKSPISSKIL